MRNARRSIVIMVLAVGLPLAAVTPSAGQTPDQITNQMGTSEAFRAAVERQAAAERAERQAAAERAERQAAAERAAAERAAAEQAAAEEAARQAAIDRAAAEEAARQAAVERAVVEQAAPPGNETAAEGANVAEAPPASNGDTIAGDGDDGRQEEAGWLVPLLIGAGAMLALVASGLMLQRLLRPKPAPQPDADHAPEPLPQMAVRPALDPSDGGVSGDEIALAGPEVRLRTALEPGGTFFDGGEPRVEREEREERDA